jgi:hypothetical protein
MPNISAQQALAQSIRAARELRLAGKHAEAGSAFVTLARGAESTSRRRAANFCAQAAQSLAQAGETAQSLVFARVALKLFGELELNWRAWAFYEALVKQFTTLGHTKGVDALRSEFSGKIVVISGMAQREPLPRGTLPANCPSCTTPMRADEVDWISASRAECDYCGIVVDAT